MSPLALTRIPGLRHLPVARLLVLAELAVLAHDHVGRLEPAERRRVIQLLRQGRGRPSNLTAKERRELALLVAKAEPKLFARSVAKKFNPVGR